MEKFESNHAHKTSHQGADSSLKIKRSPDQPSWTKEIEKGPACDMQSEREGSSRRMEKFDPNHASRTPNQGAESSLKVKISSDQPSWTKEIGKGFAYNKQSEREGSSRMME